MPTIKLPAPLRSYTGGQTLIPVQGKTVADAMLDLMRQYPTLKPHLYTEEGQLRSFVNLFLNDEDVRRLQGIDTLLQENDRLLLIPSIAGGSG